MAHEAKEYPRYMLAASECGDRLWRNAVGTYRTMDGKSVVRAGLAPYSADLIGLTRKRMTLADLGVEYAVFTSVEVKMPGSHTAAKRADGQRAWRDIINSLGGLAVQVYSVEEMKKEVERWKAGENISAF